LGHKFENGTMAPDPDRLEPIKSFPIPVSKKELERLLGLLVYYSKWIKVFATVSLPLFNAKRLGLFPLSSDCIGAIEVLKQSVINATLAVPIDNIPLDLETDASSTAIGCVLSQNGQPIAFFSHKLGPTRSALAVRRARSVRHRQERRKVPALLSRTPVQPNNRSTGSLIFASRETRFQS
jgi:hypothetical protein